MRFRMSTAALLCGILLSPIAPLGGAATATAAVSPETSTVATVMTSTRVTLALRWQVRSKRQVRIHAPSDVRCSTSRWRLTKVRRTTRIYTRFTLTCRHPADGVQRVVTVTRADRTRLTVRVLLRGDPPVAAAPGA